MTMRTPDARFAPRLEDYVGGEKILADMHPLERSIAEWQYQLEIDAAMKMPPVPLTDESRVKLQGRTLAPAERNALVRQIEGYASILDVPVRFGEYEPCFNRGHGAVYLPPITTDTGYVAAMHELGHAATVTPDMKAGTVGCELAAWRWAADRITVEQSYRCRASQYDALMSYINSPAEQAEAGDVLRWLREG